MLDFLVTSKARRRMLLLLWGQGEAGSASGLAARAGVGFASAYRELQAMRALDLVVSKREHGAEVYRANSSHPLAKALRSLVAAPSTPRESDAGSGREVRRALVALGAPLLDKPLGKPRRSRNEELEETVVRGVRLAHRDPTVARTLPVCLYLQRTRLRAERLRHHALNLGEKRSLGFFLDLTSELSGDPRFRAWAKPLRDRRCKALRAFFDTSPRTALEREAASAHTPAPARRWGLRMNLGLDAFRSTFEKFAHAG